MNSIYSIDLNKVNNHCLTLEDLKVREYIIERPYIYSYEILNMAYTTKLEAEVTKTLETIYDEVSSAKSEIINSIADKQHAANKEIAFEHIVNALDRGIRFTERKEFIERTKYTIFKPSDIYRIEFIYIDIPVIQEYLRTSLKENLIKVGVTVVVVGAIVGLATLLSKVLAISTIFSKLVATFKLPLIFSPVTGTMLANRIQSRIYNLIKLLKNASKNATNETGLPFKTTIDDGVFTMFIHGSTNFRFKNTGIWIYLEPQFRIS